MFNKKPYSISKLTFSVFKSLNCQFLHFHWQGQCIPQVDTQMNLGLAPGCYLDLSRKAQCGGALCARCLPCSIADYPTGLASFLVLSVVAFVATVMVWLLDWWGLIWSVRCRIHTYTYMWYSNSLSSNTTCQHNIAGQTFFVTGEWCGLIRV